MTTDTKQSDAVEATRKKIDDTIRALRETVDSRMLLVGLMAHAATLAQGVVAAKLVAPDEITGLFAAAYEDATKPREEPIAVYHTDGGELLGRKH